MSHSHFSFSTSVFDDSVDIRAQSVNGIVGHSLASWIAKGLTAQGMGVSDVWDEDHGWDFWISDNDTKFICICSVIVDKGRPFEAHVSLEKQRTLGDRMRGRNKPTRDDGIFVAVRLLLGECADIDNLELEF